jgi:hypothetical protein
LKVQLNRPISQLARFGVSHRSEVVGIIVNKRKLLIAELVQISLISGIDRPESVGFRLAELHRLTDKLALVLAHVSADQLNVLIGIHLVGLAGLGIRRNRDKYGATDDAANDKADGECGCNRPRLRGAGHPTLLYNEGARLGPGRFQALLPSSGRSGFRRFMKFPPEGYDISLC